MLPLKLSSDKHSAEKARAGERVLDLGECSAARASGPSFNGHASNGMFGYTHSTPAHMGAIGKNSCIQKLHENERDRGCGLMGRVVRLELTELVFRLGWLSDFAWWGRGFFVRCGPRILRGGAIKKPH